MVAGYIPLALLRTSSDRDRHLFLSHFTLADRRIISYGLLEFLNEGQHARRLTRSERRHGVLPLRPQPDVRGHSCSDLWSFLWFGYWGLLIYAIVVFVAFNTFVTYYEEPTLKKKFGTAYEDYLRKVPRWIPKFK
jgi:protein-S-isoprenylcysteine O-methyltransferase Ste14